MKQALFYEKMDNSKVRCRLCPHNCIILPGRTGICRARKNIDGELFSLNYGCVTSLALDPIEKKPLYHFHPGAIILSAGTFGCNLKCSYCQNWSIAHEEAGYRKFRPSELADMAVQYKGKGNIGIAWTYNEPSIWYEYILDTASLVKEQGLVNVLVTNGFINSGPLDELLAYIDAMNIDVKAFTDEFYKKYCKGTLDAVMNTVERAVGRCHVEITTLIIPGLNDSPEETGRLAKWLSRINPDIVLHLSRFFPSYHMKNVPPTPAETMNAARESALEHLKYVCLGNI